MFQYTLKTPGEMACTAQYMDIDKGPWINMYNAFGVAENAKPNRVAQYVGYNATPALSRVSSGESHFNVYKTMPTNLNPFEENEEPKRNRAQTLLLEYQSNAFPLGQTRSERSICICTMLSMLQKTPSKTIYCSICTVLSMLQKTSSKTIYCSIYTMLSMLQKTPSETKYCIICTMLSMWPVSQEVSFQ